MTKVEFLKRRRENLSAQIAQLGLKVLEAAYDEPRKYYVACGLYRGLKSQVDALTAEIDKEQGGDAEPIESNILDDEEDEPPKPRGGQQRRPRNWGGA